VYLNVVMRMKRSKTQTIVAVHTIVHVKLLKDIQVILVFASELKCLIFNTRLSSPLSFQNIMGNDLKTLIRHPKKAIAKPFKSMAKAGIGIGIGVGGGGVAIAPLISQGVPDISFKGGNHPQVHSKSANHPAKPTPSPAPALIPAQVWLIGKAADMIASKVNIQPNETVMIERPASNATILPVAYQQGATDKYNFSQAQRLAAKPIYRWLCNRNPQHQLYSFYTNRKQAGYLHDWHLQSHVAVGLVYNQPVPDSVGVIVFHQGNLPIYRYVRQDDAVTIAYYQKINWKANGVQFYMPTKGPFSLIPNGQRPLLLKSKKKASNINLNLHAFV
jgi:hypothetical protein